MTDRRRSSSRKAAAPRARTAVGTYWEAVQQPLYCLLFLFPLVAFYEFGAVILRPIAWPERQLVAHSLINSFMALFGASGFWLPGAALLLTLLVWHVLSRNPWQIRGTVLPLMLLESILLTVPLFVLNRVMLQAAVAEGAGLRLQIVLALGAGVYEELVFRLYLITALLLLLVDVLRVPRRPAVVIAVALAALVFALCHIKPVGAEDFVWYRFLMRLAAGGYLSLIFIGRGLGVCTGCHTAYNLILLLATPGAT